MLNQVLRLSQQEYEKSEILSKKENENIERAINERLQNISTRSDFKPKFQPGLFNPNIVNMGKHPFILAITIYFIHFL